MIVVVLILLGIALCSKEVKGAHRWIFLNLGFMKMSIQPSEFTKLIMALFVSGYCTQNFRTLPFLFDRNGLWKVGLISGIVLLGIFAGKDWGTTFLVASMIFLMLLVAGMPLRYTLLPIALIVIGAIYIYFFCKTNCRLTFFKRSK